MALMLLMRLARHRGGVAGPVLLSLSRCHGLFVELVDDGGTSEPVVVATA